MFVHHKRKRRHNIEFKMSCISSEDVCKLVQRHRVFSTMLTPMLLRCHLRDVSACFSFLGHGTHLQARPSQDSYSADLLWLFALCLAMLLLLTGMYWTVITEWWHARCHAHLGSALWQRQLAGSAVLEHQAAQCGSRRISVWTSSSKD